MCLLLLSYRAHPDVDVLLGGNRDEFFARPSRPPALVRARPRIYAGRDLEAGGTWIGRNEHGLLAALTNRRSAEPWPGDHHHSRGTIVMGLLEQAGPEAAAAWLAAEPLERYRPFNVLFGDRERFYYLTAPDGGEPQPLAPGRYVLSNATLDDRSWPKVARAHAFLDEALVLPGEAFVTALEAFLCDPPAPGETSGAAADPADTVLVDSPGYGTVSAAILTAGGALGERYYFAEGDALRRARATWAPDAMAALREGTALPAQGNPFRLLTFPE